MEQRVLLRVPMRLIVATVLAITCVVTLPAHQGWAGTSAPSGALTSQRATPAAPPIGRRGLGMRIKAGLRKLGVVGGAATTMVLGTAAAYGMHRMGISPVESAAIIATPLVLGTGALAIMAQKAKGAWTRSVAALKLTAVESAVSRGKHGELPGIIADLKQSIAVEEAGATAGGDTTKDAAKKVAFLRFALARAEMGIDESAETTQRPSGATLSAWESHLQPLATAAHATVTPLSEGKLARSLQSMTLEIKAEQEMAAHREATLASFLDHVPIAFGGALSKQAKQTRHLLDTRKESELDPEVALHGKLNTAMRGRVSNRLAGENPEFAQRRDRHGRLVRLREEHVEPAAASAREAYDELSSAISARQSEASAESQASQHKRDPHSDLDRRAKGETEDNSGTYRALAATYAESASTHTDNANAAMSTLSARLRAMHADSTFVAEQLEAMSHHTGQAEQGPSSFGELFGNEMLNQLSNWSASSSLSSQQARMQGYMSRIGQLHDQVSQREGTEHRWLEGQIDGDLARQMAAAE